MCEFSDQIEDSNSCLDRIYSPNGSCHFVEPTWVAHLLRMVIVNCEVECILRAKNGSVTWVFDGKPHARSECWLKWFRLRKPYKSRNNQKNDSSTCRFWAKPDAMSENCRYTEVINLRFPHCGIASLAQASTMGLCPLQIPANCCAIPFKLLKIQIETERSFTSVQMVHTHNHNQDQGGEKMHPKDHGIHHAAQMGITAFALFFRISTAILW